MIGCFTEHIAPVLSVQFDPTSEFLVSDSVLPCILLLCGNNLIGLLFVHFSSRHLQVVMVPLNCGALRHRCVVYVSACMCVCVRAHAQNLHLQIHKCI